MVKPVFPGSSSALLPRQEEGSRGSVGKSGSAAQRIPAVILPAPLGQQCWRGSSAPTGGLRSILGSVLTSGLGMGTFCCSSTSADCCRLPSVIEACAAENPISHGFPWELGWWAQYVCPVLRALGSGNVVLKPVGLMPLGEAFARALLVLWLEQYCWSQLWISTAGHLWAEGRLEQGPNPDVNW